MGCSEAAGRANRLAAPFVGKSRKRVNDGDPSAVINVDCGGRGTADARTRHVPGRFGEIDRATVPLA
jgi:hypothetical protein